MATTIPVKLNRYSKGEHRSEDGRFKVINTNFVGIKPLGKLNSSKQWLVVDSSGIKSLPSQENPGGYSHDAEFRTLKQVREAIAAVYARETEETNATP